MKKVIAATRNRLLPIVRNYRLRAELRRYSKPNSPYQRLSPEDRESFAPVLERWKPEDGEHTFYVNWAMTHWCNYACSYCPQDHRRDAPLGTSGSTAHAFDNIPVEKWLEAFQRHFSVKQLALKITSGEPMIDRKAMLVFLGTLTKMKTLASIRLDTNASWNPSIYKDVDRSKITLMCTFHPGQTSEDKFLDKIDMLIDDGWHIGMVKYVFSEENIKDYLHRREKMVDCGIALHPNPLWLTGKDNMYSETDTEILKKYLPPLDYGYRTVTVSPKGKKCLFPALAYGLNAAGNVHIACHNRFGSLFDDKLPEIFAGPVPCPADSCICLDMYSFIEGEMRNAKSLDPLRNYEAAMGAKPPEHAVPLLFR